MKVEIKLGMFEKTISQQLKKQNIRCDPDIIRQFQKDASALYQLYIRDVIQDERTYDKLKNRLLKQILNYVKNYGKEINS